MAPARRIAVQASRFAVAGPGSAPAPAAGVVRHERVRLGIARRRQGAGTAEAPRQGPG